MSFLKNIFNTKPDERLLEVLNNNGLVVDVRSAAEFVSGHVKDSKNIPLNTIESKIPELKKHSGNLVLCCASGNRSGMAKKLLEKHGIDCVNGGGWTTVHAACSA